MTDEDSDDDNDRMERANRIREMREGRRRGAPAEDDEPETDSETTTADEPADTDAADTDAADEADPGDEPESSDEPETSGAPETADESEPAESRSPVDEDIDESVDESGFEFEGGDETDDVADEEAAEMDGEKVETEEPTAGAEQGATEATVESGVANTVSDADAADAVDSLGVGGTFAIPDQATTVTEEDEQAMLEEAEQSVAAARAAVAGRDTAHAVDRTRVLEFVLGGERFCLDIDYIEEIVELENMTRVPNSPSYVEGVVDLRGQVTAIINPKDALAVENETRGELIIVFDSEQLDEQGNLGWIVDDVQQVTPVSEDEVNESPDDEEEEHINGIINREDEDDFIVWTTPELALNSS